MGEIMSAFTTGLCRREQKKLVAAIEKAWDNLNVQRNLLIVHTLTVNKHPGPCFDQCVSEMQSCSCVHRVFISYKLSWNNATT